MRVTLYRKLLVLWCSLSGMILADKDALVPLNFNSLYPRNDYFYVESVLKELWSDIDLLLKDSGLYDRFMYDSDYIMDQYLALEKKFEHLVQRNDDFSSYLLEDVAYLSHLVEDLFIKSAAMCQQLVGDRAEEIAIAIYEILERCRSHVITLYQQNKEVVG